MIQIRVTSNQKKEFKKKAKEKGSKTMSAFILWLLHNSSKLVIIVGLLNLIGCTTLEGLDSTRKNAPQRLKSDVFDSTYDKVFEAAKLACAESGLAIQSSSKAEGKIYAQRFPETSRVAGFILSADNDKGEMIGIYVTKLGENQTKVELAIQKIDLTQEGYRDNREIILNLIRSKLTH